MTRIRTIKPEIARHEGLYEAERATGLPMRFAWAVLPTVCDREGRFKWRPRALKADVLPYDDLDFEVLLEALVARGFLVKYDVNGEPYGCIPTFTKHQHVNQRESQSSLPGPDSACAHVHARGELEGKGRELEGKGMEDSSTPLRDDEPPVRVLFEFPVVGPQGPVWALTEPQAAEWQESFPSIDVRAESLKALAWVRASPGRRKTARGMAKFLVGWFSRTNDSRPSAIAAARPRGVVPAGAGWECPHVERCGHRTMCEVKLHDTKKYLLKDAVSA